MDTLDVLTMLAHNGISIREENGTLFVGPKDKLNPQLLDLLKQHKNEVTRLLREIPGFVPVKRFPAEIELLEADKIRATAKNRSIKQWEKLRNESEDDHAWIVYNAYTRLRKALDKKRKTDIEAWTFIIQQLTAGRCGEQWPKN